MLINILTRQQFDCSVLSRLPKNYFLDSSVLNPDPNPALMKKKEHLLFKIEMIDLAKIRAKLIATKKWSATLADQQIALYRQFLYLAASQHKTAVVPTAGIDEVWHLHILDTRKYADDCKNALGFFLHHCPTYLEGKEDRKGMTQFKVTARLFQKEFGVDLLSSRSDCSGPPCGGDAQASKFTRRGKKGGGKVVLVATCDSGVNCHNACNGNDGNYTKEDSPDLKATCGMECRNETSPRRSKVVKMATCGSGGGCSSDGKA